MDKNHYKSTAQLVFECLNKREFAPVEKFMDENLIFNFPGVGNLDGKKRTILFMKSLLRKYPKLVFSVSEVIVGENRAVAIWTNKGESSDGKAYENSGNTLFHFEGEKIVFMSDYFKDTSFVR